MRGESVSRAQNGLRALPYVHRYGAAAATGALGHPAPNIFIPQIAETRLAIGERLEYCRRATGREKQTAEARRGATLDRQRTELISCEGYARAGKIAAPGRFFVRPRG